MENSEFSKIFMEMAELLELGNENVFRVRAYQNAALNIASTTQNIEAIYKAGGTKALTELPGIGKGIADHIEELIKTSKLKAHEDLLKKFPKSLIEMIAVPGMGPKTSMLIFNELKIDSIDKLEKAARDGSLMTLPGIREKKVQNILAGIELKKRNIGRFSIGVALPYAEAIVDELKKLKEVDKIVPCGSLRRAKETIGDIDILITSKAPEKVMSAFTKLPQVERILSKGDTKSSVLLTNGMQADLRVVDPKVFGSAEHYFTGSKEHNIKIRELAIKKGLKVSEYGVFKGKKVIAGATEEEVFKAVGLPYIPPEIREDRGEFEAAKKGDLPDLIELSDIRGDLHSHTTASDGANTIKEMILAAKAKGYEYLAITDHSVSTRVAGGLSAKELLKHIENIKTSASKINGIKVLLGTEMDILPDGSLDYPDEILSKLDIVFASIHSNFKMERNAMTKRIIKAMENKYVSVISHPTGRLIGEREAYAVDLDEILRQAKNTGTFLELNSHPNRLDLDDIQCKHAKEMGIMIAITTDAHSVSGLDNIRYGVLTARRGWIEKKDVLNCLTYPQLIKKLALKRPK
jgi:DNA polymerase (family X)